MAILAMVNVPLPGLDNMTFCGALLTPVVRVPKVSVLGFRLMPGTATPVPLSRMTCGAPGALSDMPTAAVRLPVACGVKVTKIVQLAPAAKLAPQVLVCEKSLVLVPVMAKPPMVRGALPVFVNVTFCEALVEFNPWLAKVKVVALRDTSGPAAVMAKGAESLGAKVPSPA
jgi:hypothetical protein